MSFTITRVLHAGYIFESEKSRILFDPLFESPFSVNCHAFPSVEFDLSAIRQERFDAVFISHYHDDHCSFESLVHLDLATPIYIYCIYDELLDLIRELGFTQVTSLILNERISIGDIEIVPQLALDAEVDSVYEIHSHGFKILNVVDSWIDPSTVERLADQAPWDVVLWPFQTMRELAVLSPSRADPASRELPSEWLEQIERLRPRVIVPSSCQFQFESWSWMNRAMFPITYQKFAEQVRALGLPTRIVRLNPGVSFRLPQAEMGPSLKWLRPVGDQEVDYTFDEKQVIPTTGEISMRLRSLSPSMRARVQTFCTRDVFERFGALIAPESGFFSGPRIWRLSIYDPDGQPEHFQYRLNGSEISVGDLSVAPEWTTEIPATKLYSALEEGEAMTSLYVRINDQKLTAEIEAQLEGADLVEDPLLRCLYNGAFASYQRAQLSRLKERINEPHF